jgi:hypothetical protein
MPNMGNNGSGWKMPTMGNNAPLQLPTMPSMGNNSSGWNLPTLSDKGWKMPNMHMNDNMPFMNNTQRNMNLPQAPVARQAPVEPVNHNWQNSPFYQQKANTSAPVNNVSAPVVNTTTQAVAVQSTVPNVVTIPKEAVPVIVIPTVSVPTASIVTTPINTVPPVTTTP